jgi:hypothetical protein
MSTLSVRLPDSLHNTSKELKESFSLNELITLAVSEKMSALLAVDYLKERARRGDRQVFDDIMSIIPDVEPEDFDRS